jgi:stage IV sporulation protein B
MLQWYQNKRKTLALCYAVIYLVGCYVMLRSYIPDQILLTAGSSFQLAGTPLTVEEVYSADVVETDQVSPAVGTNRRFRCRLFGVLPVADIEAATVAETTVEVVGQPVGIYMKMQYPCVVGNKDIRDAGGGLVNPTAYILKDGDYITAVDGKAISTKEELQEAVAASGGAALTLTILRDEETMEVSVNPAKTRDGDFMLGLWVKDDMAGVGTLTYIDGDGAFGALGHGIGTGSSGELLPVEQGYLYQADITDITPSSSGTPGELTGLILYGQSTRLGSIEENSNVGIFGQVTARAALSLETRTCVIGYKQEICRGEAVILFGESDQVQTYQIVIDRIDYTPKEANKSFVFHVTDQELIGQMGGIVQGQSGSPILQNGKLIGAVTHVFVNDPTRGYGIFIENML